MTDTTGHIRFFIDTTVKLALPKTEVASKVVINAEEGLTISDTKELKMNKINSNGNRDLVFRQNGGEYFRFNKTTVSADFNVPIDNEGNTITRQYCRYCCFR